jgi:hypothetical protein
LIEGAAGFFNADALAEFLASQRVRQANLALAWLAAAEERLGERAALPDIAAIGRRIRERPAPLPSVPPQPWQLGYRIAAECRAQLALKPERVFGDVAAALFGGRGFEAASGRVPGLRGEADHGPGGPKIIVAGLSAAESRTFAMMRAIGDFLAFEQEGRARSPIPTDIARASDEPSRSKCWRRLKPSCKWKATA